MDPGVGQNGEMLIWKAHALAKPHPDQVKFERGDRVVSTVDLPGVVTGPEGKVILSNGFNWLRCRVLFANGVELGDLDQRQLAATGKTIKRLAKAAAR